MASLRTLLIGRRESVAQRYLIVAVVLLIGVFLSFTAGFSWEMLPIPSQLAAIIGAGLIVFLAALHAFQNDGVLVSIALSVGPITGLFIQIVSEGMTGPVTPEKAVLLGLMWGVVFGIPLGVVGYILGAGGQRVFGSGDGNHSPRSST